VRVAPITFLRGPGCVMLETAAVFSLCRLFVPLIDQIPRTRAPAARTKIGVRLYYSSLQAINSPMPLSETMVAKVSITHMV
jgi:hypothetical protein